MRLFEITQQFKALEQLEDDVPPEVMADTLEGLQGDFEEKVIEISKFILNLEAEAKARDEAAKLMQRRADRMKKHADRIRHYVLLQMQMFQWRGKIKTSEFVISRKNNPAAVQITNESNIPLEYWRQPDPAPMVPDKKLIREKLQAGEEIPGAYLESGERVSIDL